MRINTKFKMLFGAALVVGSLGWGALANASDPTVTLSGPTNNQTLTSSTVDVSGTFETPTDVKRVDLVVCKLNSSNRCTEYVSNATGDMVTKWSAVGTSLSTTDNRTGAFSLSLSGLTNAKYQLAAYAVDQATAKGPRAYVQFTVDVSDDDGDEDPEVPPAVDPNKGYITVMWGRSNWQATYKTGANCTTVSNARTLEQNAQDLSARGLFGVGGVVVSRTAETGISCFNGYTTQPSWTELAMLRDSHNWQFISQGMNYENMTLMTTDAQRRYESLDTLPILASHGHERAWGAFNYANNKQDAAAQAIVSQGFAFGRKYGAGKNTQAKVSQAPYIMDTNSVNGGRCNNPNLPCYNMTIKNNRRTTSVTALTKLLSPAKNEWGVVQFYRLVEGKRGSIGDSFAWDCTSSDWRNRWSSQPELYCRESFLEILDNRTTTANIADPATVAEAWGVLPANR